MKVISTTENDNANYYTKKFVFDDNIQIESLISFVKQFETPEYMFSTCHCDTYDEDGSQLYRKYDTIEDIIKIAENHSPYISFCVEFCNRESMRYGFSLVANTNSNVLSYVVNKKKLSFSSSKSAGRR